MKLKKLLIVLIIGVMCFGMVGCGKENIKIDLKQANEEILKLTGDDFDLSFVEMNVTDPEREVLFEEFMSLYSFDLENMMGVNSDYIEEMNAGKELDEDSIEMYLVIKPVEDKKDILKKDLDAYFSNLKLSAIEDDKALLENMKYEEYEGHMIYIVSSKADKIMERIKESKPYLYGMMVELNDETVKSLLNLNPEDLEEYLIQLPMITQSSTYMILKPVDGKKQVVKEKLDKYFDEQEEQWKTYLPDQYEIIKNRTYTEIGDYMIYVASSNNDKVIETIEKNKVEVE